MNDLDILIGKRIIEVLLQSDGENIIFETDQGRFIFDAMGDCCSNSWVHDIIDYEFLEGGIVTGIENKNIYREDNHPQHDCLQVYNYDIKTDKGTATIDFRNESNGYYGGWLQLRHAND